MKDIPTGILIAIALIIGITIGQMVTMSAVNAVYREIDVREEIEQVKILARLIDCESGFRPNIPGKDGENGLLQFKKPTFDWMKNQANMPELSWRSSQDQMALTWWALRNGYGGHWTCYAKASDVQSSGFRVQGEGGHVGKNISRVSY